MRGVAKPQVLTGERILSNALQVQITYTCGDAIRKAITYTLRVITYCCADAV